MSQLQPERHYIEGNIASRGITLAVCNDYRHMWQPCKLISLGEHLYAHIAPHSAPHRLTSLNLQLLVMMMHCF